MNKTIIISFFSLIVLAGLIPAYAYLEPQRMAQAQVELRQEYVSDAAVLYVENCGVCHGAAGEGIGVVPGLDNPDLREADYDYLFKTIARGRYETTMAGWHKDEGGIFNDYQVDELVALIRYVDWPLVSELAASQGLIPPTMPVPQVEASFLQEIAALGEEGELWAKGMETYANNCTICHGLNGEGSDLGVRLNNPEVRAKDIPELVRIISDGVSGTLMAGWDKALQPDEIDGLVAFLKNWDVIEAQGLALVAPQPLRIDLDNPEEVMALGEHIFDTTCSVCHGDNGTGAIGPALNSLQVLTRNSDEQLENTIINGGHRPNSSMPAFGDRLTSVEIGALVDYIRSWEAAAVWVENPRGTSQGGGPPWLRATPNPDALISPQGADQTDRRGQGTGPPWRQENTGSALPEGSMSNSQATILLVKGTVVSNQGNALTVLSDDGQTIEAMLGPPWFWEENGIPLNQGDQIELEGFESTDHLEVNWLSNLTAGQHIILRTGDGQPVWSNNETSP